MPEGYRPLSLEELTEAGDIFFSRFNIISERMPQSSTIEDTLKVMEKVLKLGHHQRRKKEKLREFGFGIKRAIGFFQPEAGVSEEVWNSCFEVFDDYKSNADVKYVKHFGLLIPEELIYKNVSDISQEELWGVCF